MKWCVLGFVLLFATACDTDKDAERPTAVEPVDGKGDAFGSGSPSSDCPDPSTLTRPEFDSCRGEDGRFVNTECCLIRCTNVHVDLDINGGLFEEGYGSAFDIDPRGGETLTDGSSNETMIELAPLDADGPQTEITLGQRRFDSDDLEITSSIEDGTEGGIRVYDFTSNSGDEFQVRLFDEPQVGVLMVKEEGDDRLRHYSTFDCRPGAEPLSF